MQPKRILISLLAVILICLAAGLTVSAAETSPLNLAVSVSSDAAISKSPVTVQAGDTLEVSVTVAENPGVAVLEFTLEYDPAAISVKTDGEDVVYTNGDVFSDDAVLLVFEKAPGVLVVRYISSVNATATNATLITVEFTALSCEEEARGASAVSLVVDPRCVSNAAYDYVDVFADNSNSSFAAHEELTPVKLAEHDCETSTYQCATCGQEVVTDPKAEHQLATVPGVPAKCGVTGVSDSVSCSVCGFVAQEAEVLPALAHELTPVAAKAPSCLEPGWEAYEECTREGCDYNTKVELPALGHDLESVAAKAPTCLEDGWKAYEVCKREGCDYTTYEVDKALGSHTPVTDPAVEPTYSTEGKTEGSHCSVCGEIIVAQQPVPAKSLLWLWILIAVVVVVAAGVVVYFFVYRKNVKTKHIGRPGSRR